MRTINFISENQKQAVVLGKDNNLVEYLADLEKRIPERKFDGLSVQYNKDLSIAAVNGLPFEQFLSQNPVYNKTDFEQQFKYCCIANDIGGNYVTLDVTVEGHCPKNTNTYSLDVGDVVERQIKGGVVSEELEAKIKEIIETFNYYTEEDPKARKFTSLVFELKYFRFSGHQFPVRVRDLTGQFNFLLDKSARFVYEFDFDNEEELMTAIYMATKPTNLQLWQEPVSE
ncbi:hypothetical protein M8850_02420 [Pasteurella multocida]|uniref:hypothetical protein n=1 Tax=Pasteurella multocida TaxID=747 RepID=UPI0020238243|nr:hypothetical protein [Pasteurella multocida]URH94604.1 hypothetical protein M8850_02420 [Pasteurella multocida]URI00992.1 hypothetical protein M8851_02420 [Pasteurella multocida]HEA3250356.1 hypothetical protein [Pasteurella multocida]